MRTTLYLLFGYPGAGKTTTAKIIEGLTGATRLSSDEVRLQLFPNPQFTAQEHAEVYTYLNSKCRRLLTEGKSVIYDANLNRRAHRQEKYDIAKGLNAETVLFWIKTPRKLAKERAVGLERSHFVPQHETANEMFERIAGVIEPPDTTEATITLDGTHISQEEIKDALKQATA
jgi:predicted kinase